MSADLLAGSRFTVSPLAECVAALTVLERPSGPWQRAFHAGHRAAFDEMLAEHPVRRALVARLWRPRVGRRPGWLADFLAVPPSRPGMGFGEELDLLAREWNDERIRSVLRGMRPGRLPAVLCASDLRAEVLALLQWVWTATIAADWPRRERVLRADIVSRTATLATRGWSGVVPTLGASRDWLGDGRLRINRYDLPDRDLTGAESLFFIPVHANGSWVAWEEPRRYAIVYPVTGALTASETPSPDGLARLMGRNRAGLLTALDEPRSPTQLAALTDLPLGAVGNHLRVMLDAGLVLRRRAGREVLYWRTDLGDALVASTRT